MTDANRDEEEEAARQMKELDDSLAGKNGSTPSPEAETALGVAKALRGGAPSSGRLTAIRERTRQKLAGGEAKAPRVKPRMGVLDVAAIAAIICIGVMITSNLLSRSQKKESAAPPHDSANRTVVEEGPTTGPVLLPDMANAEMAKVKGLIEENESIKELAAKVNAEFGKTAPVMLARFVCGKYPAILRQSAAAALPLVLDEGALVNTHVGEALQMLQPVISDTNEDPLVRRTVLAGFKLLNPSSKAAKEVSAEVRKVIALEKDEPSARLAAIATLGTIDPGAAADVLPALLSSESDDVRQAAAAGLASATRDGAARVPQSLPRLMAMLRDNKERVDTRAAAAQVLGNIARTGGKPADEAVAALQEQFVNAKDDDIIRACVEAAGRSGRSEFLKALINTYRDFLDKNKYDNPKDFPVRVSVMKACKALLNVQSEQKQPDFATVKALVALLVTAVDEDMSVPVKVSAVRALKSVYPKKFQAEHKEVLSATIMLVKQTKDADLLEACAQTLQAVTGQDFGTDYDKWMKWFAQAYPRKATP